MICRLCLNESAENIDIFSEDKIREYIINFLQLELTPEDLVSKVICTICWQELDNFQGFYHRVKDAQRSLVIFQLDKDQLKMEIDEISTGKPFVEYVTIESDPLIEDSDEYEIFEILEVHKEELTESTFTSNKVATDLDSKIQAKDEIAIEVKSKSVKSGMIQDKSSKTDEGFNLKRKRKLNTNRSPRESKRKIPSERSKKLLETSKKFDEIIKKHMTLYCELCGLGLTDFAELKSHFRRVHNLKGYAVCCNKRMYKRHLVVDHITSHDGTSYICNVCGKKASSRDALRSHLKYVHLTKREFQCTHCNKAFKKALDLREHTATHTGEVLYMCPHCTKTFTSRATLHGHRKEKHRAEWEANKRCSYF